LNEAAEYFGKYNNGVVAITLGKDGTLIGIQGETRIIPSISYKTS